MSLSDRFERKFNCEIEEKSDLSPIKEAKQRDDLTELENAVGLVQGDHAKEKIVTSGVWIFRVTWNEDLESVQVSCYGYSAGIIYNGAEGENQ